MFNPKSFSVMAYSNGFTLWNFVSTDSPEEIKGEGYFDDIAPFARAGDMIFAISSNQESATSMILPVAKITNSKVALGTLA